MSSTLSARIPIYLAGATGYLGGSVLNRLLAHAEAGRFDITVTTRSAEKAKLLKDNFPVTAVVASNAELNTIAALAEAAHVVFSCADSDDLPAIQAILRGMQNRHAKTGDVPILIHTSGTAVFLEDARGMYPGTTSYTDTDVAQIESIPDAAPHRGVDLATTQADDEGYVRTHIVLPSTIYGTPSGPVFEKGIANTHSIQIPNLIKAALARKQGGMVGQGKSIWNSVHIDDIADLYIAIYDAATADPSKAGHGREGYYIGENGEHAWGDIGVAISKALVELGLGGSAEPTAFTKEELDKYLGGEGFANVVYGSNARGRGARGRAIGWQPKKTTQDMLESIKPEVEALLREGKIIAA